MGLLPFLDTDTHNHRSPDHAGPVVNKVSRNKTGCIESPVTDNVHRSQPVRSIGDVEEPNPDRETATSLPSRLPGPNPTKVLITRMTYPSCYRTCLLPAFNSFLEDDTCWHYVPRSRSNWIPIRYPVADGSHRTTLPRALNPLFIPSGGKLNITDAPRWIIRWVYAPTPPTDQSLSSSRIG